MKPDEASEESEDWRETSLLGDCVWFIMRLVKYLKEEHRSRPEQPGYQYLLHSSLVLLNKYVVKLGLKASLMEKDRFLVALACYFISAKVNSQFIRSKELLEFYYLNRPISSGNSERNDSPAALQSTSPAFASNLNSSSLALTPAERQSQLKTFNSIRDELASELFTIEFDIIL